MKTFRDFLSEGRKRYTGENPSVPLGKYKGKYKKVQRLPVSKSVKKGDVLRTQRVSLSKRHHNIGEIDPNLEKNVISKELKKAIEKGLSKLTDREAGVLRYRFGLKGGKEHSIADISKKYKRSTTRIRQIEWTALKKLRSSSISKYLKPFVESIKEIK
jgi:DNA-directed RNA polymerase sigma subunit (sigma70/sigma32)